MVACLVDDVVALLVDVVVALLVDVLVVLLVDLLVVVHDVLELFPAGDAPVKAINTRRSAKMARETEVIGCPISAGNIKF